MPLSPRWRRALEILTVRWVGASDAELIAEGFSAEMVESLVRVGFAETTQAAVRSGEQSIGILRITERGRIALAAAAPASVARRAPPRPQDGGDAAWPSQVLHVLKRTGVGREVEDFSPLTSPQKPCDRKGACGGNFAQGVAAKTSANQGMW